MTAIYDFEITSKENLLAKAKYLADKLNVDLDTILKIMILEELQELKEFTEQNGKFLYEIMEK